VYYNETRTSFFYFLAKAHAPSLIFWGVCGLEHQVNINIFNGVAFFFAQMLLGGICGQDMHHKVQELSFRFFHSLLWSVEKSS